MPANESPYSLRSKGKVESIEEADLSSVSTSLFPPSSPSSLSSFATTRQQKKLVKLQEQRERRKEEEEDRVRKIPFHLLSDKNVNEWLRKQKLRSKVRQRNTRVSRQPNEQNEIEHLMARGVTELDAAILICDADDNTITYASPGFSLLCGYGEKEIIGKTSKFLQECPVPEEERSREQKLWQKKADNDARKITNMLREDQEIDFPVANFTKTGTPISIYCRIMHVQEGREPMEYSHKVLAKKAKLASAEVQRKVQERERAEDAQEIEGGGGGGEGETGGGRRRGREGREGRKKGISVFDQERGEGQEQEEEEGGEGGQEEEHEQEEEGGRGGRSLLHDRRRRGLDPGISSSSSSSSSSSRDSGHDKEKDKDKDKDKSEDAEMDEVEREVEELLEDELGSLAREVEESERKRKREMSEGERMVHELQKQLTPISVPHTGVGTRGLHKMRPRITHRIGIHWDNTPRYRLEEENKRLRAQRRLLFSLLLVGIFLHLCLNTSFVYDTSQACRAAGVFAKEVCVEASQRARQWWTEQDFGFGGRSKERM